MIIKLWRDRASIVDFTFFLFLGILFLFLLKAFPSTPYRFFIFAIYLGLLLILWLMGRFRFSRVLPKWKNGIQFLYPVLFLVVLFESFFMLVPFFNGNRFDPVLIQIDYAIFGVHPTVWIERWIVPWFTELMYSCYVLYFPMPLVPVIYLYRIKDWEKLERALFIFIICYFSGYIGYFLFPASGPRFNLNAFQTVTLEGIWLTEPIRKLIDILEPNKLDAFPSLHSAILLTTMLVTYPIHRKLFYWFIPLAVGISISLIYCRYHYAVDVLAGFAWSVIGVWVANILFQKYQNNFIPHFNNGNTKFGPASFQKGDIPVAQNDLEKR